MADTILRKNPHNKAALHFLASAQISMNLHDEAQDSLNQLYGMLEKGADDRLFIESLFLQDKLFQAVIEHPETPKNTVSQAKRHRIQNKFKIIDFFDSKNNFEKMLSETDHYVELLYGEEAFKTIEETYVWLMGHAKLDNETRQRYGCLIFEIDNFYKPFTPLITTFEDLWKLSPVSNPLIKVVAYKVLVLIEKSTGKKDFYSAIQASQQDANIMKVFIQQSQCHKLACQILFHENPEEIVKNRKNMRDFARYITYEQICTIIRTPAWEGFIEMIQKLTESEHFQCEDHKEKPVVLLCHAILDVNRVIQTGILDPNQYYLLQKYGTQVQDITEAFANEYRSSTPIVNIYCSMCLITQKTFDATNVISRLYQAEFLLRKIYRANITAKKQPSDLTILSFVLKLIISPKLQGGERDQTLILCEQSFSTQGRFAGKAIQDLYASQISQIRWATSLAEGRWQDSLVELDKIAAQPDKKDYAEVKKSWVKYSFLDRIADSEEDRRLVLQSIYADLAAVKDSAESLLLQGNLLFVHSPEQLGIGAQDKKAPLNKWLMALKKDQTNPDIFYSLALYYYARENDLARTQKCLDKALLLRPDFQDAFVLQYLLLIQQGKKDQALALLTSVQHCNRNLASCYYLQGLHAQNNREYIQAIDNYQNAAKFYKIAKERAMGGLKSQFPPLSVLNLQIHQHKLGIFGAHPILCVSVWVHLAECHAKIQKPLVAEKCLIKSMEEIDLILAKQEVKAGHHEEEVTETMALTRQVIQMNWPEISHQHEQADPIARTVRHINTMLKADKPPQILFECIESLLVGTQVMQKQEDTFALALTAVQVMTRFATSSSLVAFALSQLVSKYMLQEKVNFETIKEVTQLLDSQTDDAYVDNQHLQKTLLNAYFMLAKEYDTLAHWDVAMNKGDALVQRFCSSKELGPSVRSFYLDLAKIIHERQKFDASYQEKKVGLIKRAIQFTPSKAELWVYLHLFFEQDHPQRAAAIYKAYELDPESVFVQEHLIKFYLQSPKTWKKAFRVIIQSINQTAELIQHGAVYEPIVIAVLAYVNAQSFFMSKNLNHNERKHQLLEALSLVKKIEQEDLKALFESLAIFLQQEKGEYQSTIKYLEKATLAENVHLYIKILLMQAYFGSNVHNFDHAKKYAESILSDCKNTMAEQLKAELQYILNIEQVPDEALKEEATQMVAKFLETPQTTAQKLSLLLEICIRRGVVPDDNLLDHENFEKELMTQNQDMQRQLILQSLRLCQLRDGEIKEEKQDSPEDDVINYSRALYEAGRKRPTYISSNLQHKALLKLYLASMTEPLTRARTLKLLKEDVRSNKNDSLSTEIKAIRAVLGQHLMEKIYCQRSLMRDPTCLKMNVNWIWGLLMQGKIENAHKAMQLLDKKMSIQGYMKNVEENFNKFITVKTFLAIIMGEEADASNLDDELLLIAYLCRKDTPEKLEGDKMTEIIKHTAIGLLKAVTNCGNKEQQWMLSEAFRLLRTTVFSQGQYNVMNRLCEMLLQVATSVSEDKKLRNAIGKSQSLLNEIWLFKCLHAGSGLLELKKMTGVAKESSTAEKALLNGTIRRSSLPALLIQARQYVKLQNYQSLSHVIEQSSDEATIERDFILAVAYNSQQAYKMFYLTTMGLVAGTKAIVEAAKHKTNQMYYNLGYAYYLKAFAESTFLAARKQGIKLKEDFTREDKHYPDEYNQAFFQRKAATSLKKAKINLTMAGEEGLLLKAIEEMILQV